MATVAALPENIDEAMFAGIPAGQDGRSSRAGRSVGIDVPAHAEFVLEGDRASRASGGWRDPFGDHFGHYSHAADFPVFHVQRGHARRRDPVFPATVVGIPPMEDKFLGDATQRILGPLVRLLHAEISGDVGLLRGGLSQPAGRGGGPALREGSDEDRARPDGDVQLSLTKCIILVSEGVNVRDFERVMNEVRDHFDPHFDFVHDPARRRSTRSISRASR